MFDPETLTTPGSTVPAVRRHRPAPVDTEPAVSAVDLAVQQTARRSVARHHGLDPDQDAEPLRRRLNSLPCPWPADPVPRRR